MADHESLKRTVKLCMFDQYGSVVDMQGGPHQGGRAVS